MADTRQLDRLRSVIERVPVPMVVFEGPEQRICAASRAFRQVVGGRDVVGELAPEALVELARQGLLDQVAEVWATGRPGRAEGIRVTLDSGAARQEVDFAVQVLKDLDGEPWGVMAAVEERGGRERSELAMRAHQLRLQQVLDALPVGVLLANEDGSLYWQNPASRRIWAGSLDDFASYKAWWADSERPVLPQEWGLPRALRGEESSGEVIDIRTFDGRRRTLLNSAATLRDDAGVIIGAVAVYEDITEAREREKQRTLIAAALEGLQEGVCVVDAEGGVVYANRAFSGILELGEVPPGAALGDLVPEQAGELAAALRTAVQAGRWSGRLRRVRPEDGRETTLEAVVGRVGEPGRGRILLFGILRDISGQLQVERQLRQAERLASLGTLVGGVAHELNNPLSAVLGFTELMLLEERPAAEREDLQTIRREAERMARIVADLKLLARGASHDLAAQRVDLNDVVRHVARSRAHACRREGIEVREDLAADLPAVHADAGRLEQALLNLVVNAEQAMASIQGARRLILRTRPTAQGATLQVVDSGPGIPPRHLERIFDPFFTTKGPGEGTGLGLALVHTIIAEHGGEIRVDSEVGGGTAFRVDLPRAPDAEPATGERAVTPPEPPRMRVLVVDDENPVRRVVVRYLARLGCETEEAADGRQALVLLDWAEVPFDAILSDLHMPGLGGEALLARLEERGLADRLIFLTGDTAREVSAQTLAGTAVPVLAKPVSMDALAAALESVRR